MYNGAMKKIKKEKKKKLESIPKINRRLFKLWSEAVRERAGFKCEYCGIENKAVNINGVKTKLDAHHFVSRKVKDMPLKFEIMNGVCACPICHKWGVPSFHRDPITTITWLIKNRPDRYEFVLKNVNFRVSLDNRSALASIEKSLQEKKSLDFVELKRLDGDYQIEMKKKNEEKQAEKDAKQKAANGRGEIGNIVVAALENGPSIDNI